MRILIGDRFLKRFAGSLLQRQKPTTIATEDQNGEADQEKIEEADRQTLEGLSKKNEEADVEKPDDKDQINQRSDDPRQAQGHRTG